MSRQTLDDDPVPTNNNNQWQSRPVLEWDNQQVCLWLVAMNMDEYTSEFSARGVDGTQLLNMDSEKLKVSGQDTKMIYTDHIKSTILENCILIYDDLLPSFSCVNIQNLLSEWAF